MSVSSRIAGVVVLAGLTLGVNGAIATSSSVDQTDLPANFAAAGTRFDGDWGLVSSTPAAQSFVAGRSGRLTQVVLPIVGCNGVPASTGNPTQMKPGVCQADVPQIDVKITGLGSGRIDANVLAEAASVTPPPPFTANPSAAHVTVTFSPAPAVTRGRAYAIVVTPLSPWPPASYEWANYSKTDRYAHGMALWDYRGAWRPVRSAPYQKVGARDFGFATYVAPS